MKSIVDELAVAGVMVNVEYTNGRYRFAFKNQEIKDCLWKGERILELYTYQKEKKQSDDCKEGVC